MMNKEFNFRKAVLTIAKNFTEASNSIKKKEGVKLKKGAMDLYRIDFDIVPRSYLTSDERDHYDLQFAYYVMKDMCKQIESCAQDYGFSLEEEWELTREEIDSINQQIKEKKKENN